MEKENTINKRIVYSIVAIFIIIGIIVGATYAYFSARSNTERQTVTTAKMELDITPKDAEIIGSNLMPITEAQISSKAAKKTFTVTSTNNVDIAVNMGIEIESITGNLAVADFKWEVYEGTDTTGTKVGYGTFYGAQANDTISTNSTIFEAPGETKTYTMYVYILETNQDQNSMQNGTFNFKIYAEGLFDQVASTVYEEDSLAYNLLGNLEDIEILNNPLEGTSSIAYNNSNNGISLMSNSAKPMANTSGYKGLYKTTDNDGVTYYFTGDVGNNYVVFGDYGTEHPGDSEDWEYIGVSPEKHVIGGESIENPSSIVKSGDMYKYLWRIVRINGDGTIRLALNSLIGYNDRKIDERVNNNLSWWIGRGWSFNGSTSYENSQMDTDLQYWYNVRNLNASGLIVPSKYCVDSSRNITGSGLSYTCKNEITRNIGLLTTKDLEYSGITSAKKVLSTTNRSYLDFNLPTKTMGFEQDSNFYTMTPGNDNNWNTLSIIQRCPDGTSYWYESHEYGVDWSDYCIEPDGTEHHISRAEVEEIFIGEKNNDGLVKPVINIKADAIISSGNGTYADPYVIEY